MLANGTLIEFSSWGNNYTGFVIGTCSYDNCGEPNAYVVRYVTKNEEDKPRKPYTIVALDVAKPIKEFPSNFLIGSYWSATPKDRCKEWELQKDQQTGNLLIVPVIKEL